MKYIYFIGIGGIGMSAIARYYNHLGCKVSGYDKTPSKLTSALEKEGIDIHYEDDIEFIPKEKKDTIVIYTPAIPQEMNELIYVQENGYKLIKRSKALAEIASNQKCLAVAGTHGKTTTSTILAHILKDSGEGCNAFLGGISSNYNTNLLLSKNPVLVAEADEFDKSFLQLFPEIAVITSTDADHLDIYSDHNTLKETFTLFGEQVKESLILRKGLEKEISTTNIKAKIYSYSFNEPSDFYGSEIIPLRGGYFLYTFNTPTEKISGCILGFPGWINVENAIGASAAAYLHGTSLEKIKKSLKNFSGIERRFEVHVSTGKSAYIDDYAHHPKEISSAISSIRNIFPGRKLCGIFQPHLYTRTRDFYIDFAKSLSELDELILLPIYPAREEAITGIESEIILERAEVENKIIIEKTELLEELRNRNIDVLITFGAGDIDRFILPIKELILEKNKC